MAGETLADSCLLFLSQYSYPAGMNYTEVGLFQQFFCRLGESHFSVDIVLFIFIQVIECFFFTVFKLQPM